MKTAATPYQVLARKYRPSSLRELIGQDILVKTLTNAIQMNRMPHAILLTGIRGVGKTTTARIIAKIINCTQLSTDEDATYVACNACKNCIDISNAQHIDIVEMDAASNTSVNDVRIIIENAHYKPAVGQYKVYIIDEVHMLSNSAFNALLKTLEEPPQHLIFIFATTEIQKIPLTVLSRCQRFDLRRVHENLLQAHYLGILHKEGVTISDVAMGIIVKAADGSVRDGLSILEQAIALSHGIIEADQVRDMLCINNNAQIAEIFMYLIRGQVQSLISLVDDLYFSGSDPVMITNQILEIVHCLSKNKVLGLQYPLEGFTSKQLQEIETLQIPFLARSWQILLNGLEEIKKSSMPFKAFEMLLIKLCYMSVGPTPEEILHNGINTNVTPKDSIYPDKNAEQLSSSDDSVDKKLYSKDPNLLQADPLTRIDTIEDLMNRLYDRHSLELYHVLKNEVAIVSFQDGCIVLNPLMQNIEKFLMHLRQELKLLTKKDWMITVADGGMTLQQAQIVEYDQLKKDIEDNEVIKEVLGNFTGSKIADIKANNKK